MATFFSDFFGLDPKVIEDYGAFNVSLVTDLPLFIDPFLLFNSKKKPYRDLHDQMIEYLLFLRGKAVSGVISDPLLRQWYCFPEVKQTWLGFAEMGNAGHGLGIDFARALHGSLNSIFADFGKERITKGSHLEKVCLIKDGVGRDNISDFTTNLIKGFLYQYTEAFAFAHLRPEQRREISVATVEFNYDTEMWEPKSFTLPWMSGDHVVLTPRDLLTRDDNWINRKDLISGFDKIPASIPDADLRALVNNYFRKVLVHAKGRHPTKKQHDDAAARTIRKHPELIDYYIRLKEAEGGKATNVSAEKVRHAQILFDSAVRGLQDLLNQAGLYSTPATTYQEAHQRVGYLKDVIENKGGHRNFYSKSGLLIRHEKDLQTMFRLVWFGSPSDVSAEVDDGRGPADFKVSRGAKDKTIIEMKLAKNTQLKRNLEAQTEIYQKASDASKAIKVVIFFSAEEGGRVQRILKELKLTDSPDIVLIDGRRDNKPSGSRAKRPA